ncbi:MAG: DUF885 domain-containing protein, partial [Chloroflexota bacterium]
MTDTLRTLADRFWDDFLEAHPTWATIIGDRRFDDQLDEVSPSAVAARIQWFDRVAADAGAIPVDSLTSMEQVTRQMLIDEAMGGAASLRTRMDEWTVDPLGGPTVSLLDLADYQTIATPEDGAALVERWRAIGRYLDQMGANLREAAADGFVAVNKPVERVLDVLGNLEATPADEWKLMAPAAEAHDDWSETDLKRFREAVEGAVREIAIPAFRRYRETLERAVLPVARPEDRPGLVHLPGGAETYRECIHVHTTLDLTPEEIHATGLAEIARIDAEFVELGGRVLGTKDLASTLGVLRSDRKLYFETADEVFATAKRSLVRATAAVTDWFGRVPGAACVVMPVPSHSEVHQTIAYYSWPALDGSRPGRYYINLHAPETRPRYEAEALAFHEAVPGHHLQIA